MPTDGSAGGSNAGQALLGAWRVRGYRLFLIATLTSLFGTEIYRTVLPFLVLDTLGSATSLGLILTASSLAQTVFLLFGGVLVDRWSLRRVLIAADLVQLTMELVLIGLYASGSISLWFLVLFSAVAGVVRAVIAPASRTAFAALLPHRLIAGGVSLREIGEQAISILAPPVAGLLIPVIGIAGALAIDAATFALSALFFRRGLPGSIRERTDDRLLSQIGAGFAFVGRLPWLRDTIVSSALTNWLFAGAVTLALPILAAREMHGVLGYGILTGALAVGGVVGAVVVARATSPHFHVRRYATFKIAQGLLLGVVAVAATLPETGALLVASAAMLLFGFNIFFIGVEYEQAIQIRVPQQVLGRVLSLDQLGSMATLPIGYAITGFVVDTYGPQTTIFSYGMAIGLTGIVMVGLAAAFKDAYDKDSAEIG